MFRWLLRLIVLGLIGAGITYAVRRFMGQEEDFDEYDDIEAGFEFRETPVEIDVPAQVSSSTGGTESSSQSLAARGGDKGDSTRMSTNTNTSMDSGSASGASGASGASEAGAEMPGLIEINGIGPSYEARLQAAGINTIADLAKADANTLNEQLDVIGGVSSIEDWIAQAKEMASGSSKAHSNGHAQQ